MCSFSCHRECIDGGVAIQVPLSTRSMHKCQMFIIGEEDEAVHLLYN